ncbi:unnamed protein product, partial [Cyprideis torosa]
MAAKPTIMKVLKDGGAVILMSHLGRPKDCLEIEVHLAADVVGEDAEKQVKRLEMGEILLLENVRFRPEEEAGDAAFAEKLASF